MVIYAYLFLIIALANDLFNLVDLFIPGVFHVKDVGIALIGLGLLYYLLRSQDLGRLSNFFTWYIFIYLLLVLVQASIASFKYSQSILDGLIAARHQFYYLSFPLFLFGLNDIEKIKKFMGILTVTALILIILSLINYFGLTIFYHSRAEGHGIRAGIVRAYVPAMEILVLTAIWHFWKYLNEDHIITRSLWIFLLIFSGIIFRQSRGHIIAVSAVLVMMLIANRRFKTLMGLGFFLMALVLMLNFTMEQNILLNAFQLTYVEMTEQEGNWAARLRQIENSLHVLLENFWTGSGGLVIRGDIGQGWWSSSWDSMRDIAYSTDLGYWVWLKFFGLPGLVLMLVLISIFYWRVLRTTVTGERYQIVRFVSYEFTCILISMVTLTYFINEKGTVILCLTWALLVNASYGERQRSTFVTNHVSDTGYSDSVSYQR